MRKRELNRELNEQKAKTKQEARKMDSKVAESHEKLATLSIQLKEKEQENRITKLKAKELRR